MKEEIKIRLKKFGKVSAYGLGLFAMLLLGVGLGNCSAKGKPEKTNAETGLSLADQMTLQPKRAVDPAYYPTLNPSDDNLLRNAEVGHYRLRRFDYDDLQGYRVEDGLIFDMYLINLGAGAFVMDYTSPSLDWSGDYWYLNDDGAEQVHKRLNGEPSQRVYVELSDTDFGGSLYNGDFRRLFNVSSSFPWLCLFVDNRVQLNVSLAVYDPLTAPAVASFDFPVIFNPYPLGGSPAIGDFIFNGPHAGDNVQTDVIRINNLSFRSNGKFYDSIWFSVTHDRSQTFGHYDASGNFVLDGALGSSAWYFRNMVYRYGNQYADVVWNAKFESEDGNPDWKPSLVSGGIWVAQEYRHIEVLSFNGSTLLDLPSTSLVAGSSVESVLKLLASYVPPAVEQMGNPFTLLKEGFSAVGGILSIQILPFMTLGTLVFVPLVVLVILAILKLLAK